MSDFVDDQALGGELGSPSSKSNASELTNSNPELLPKLIEEQLGQQSSRIVTWRGTEDGLVLRIDGKADWTKVLADVELFLGERKNFFEGGQISVEWLERLPTPEQAKSLEEILRSKYSIEIGIRKRKPLELLSNPLVKNRDIAPVALFEDSVLKSESGARNRDRAGRQDALLYESEYKPLTSSARGKSPRRAPIETEQSNTSLMDMLGMGDDFEKRLGGGMAKLLGDELYLDEEANAKIVFGTLRSGQRVETPFSLVVIGDVNPGADLIAGGDIIVLGSLRGTAHAAAYDDELTTKRVIIGLHMRPIQLRIGSVISRGSDDVVDGAEIAHIEDRRIVVEAFHSKVLNKKKLAVNS